ncbi:MAG TPA: hypothetical protein VHF27_07910 [Acidimicrobiales bacterium]|nr:hypothetical protein [Acidimicrobiales bacterium]
MFFPGSRYEKVGTYLFTVPDGTQVAVSRLPLPPLPGRQRLLGFHRRLEGQRLDHVANHYLNNPTTFWRLCDANGAVSPDALGRRALIAVPAPEG